jgi:hypothetical protein
VPPAVVELLGRACTGLAEAAAEPDPGERYVVAHLAALRAGAAVLSARTPPQRKRRPVNVWEALPTVAAELEDWATYFATGAARRAAVEAGRAGAVGAGEADEHLRGAEAFVNVVTDLLGTPSPQAHLPLVAS